MSTKWPGGIISKTAPTITAPTAGVGGSASGIWTMDEVLVHEKASNWPKPPFGGELWTWGEAGSGQLGDGSTVDKSSPVQVGSLTNWSSVSAGDSHMLALKPDGTAWAQGANQYGQLGDGNTTNLSSPVQIGTLTNWEQVSCANWCSYGIKTDGTLWAWGDAVAGALGQGNTTSHSSPVQVGSDSDWIAVTAQGSYQSCTKLAIKKAT